MLVVAQEKPLLAEAFVAAQDIDTGVLAAAVVLQALVHICGERGIRHCSLLVQDLQQFHTTQWPWERYPQPPLGSIEALRITQGHSTGPVAGTHGRAVLLGHFFFSKHVLNEAAKQSEQEKTLSSRCLSFHGAEQTKTQRVLGEGRTRTEGDF